jgi:hypothetical protein
MAADMERMVYLVARIIQISPSDVWNMDCIQFHRTKKYIEQDAEKKA